jgi:Protein of unknown function (DUF2934)
MSEPESMMQVRDEAARGKGAKGKAIIKRGKTADTSSRQQDAQQAPADSRRSEARQADESGAEEIRDPQMIAKIQQRAYGLFEASGCEHGHDLEHWLEAERQITGTSNRGAR